MSHFIWGAFKAMLEAGQSTSAAKSNLQTLFPQYSEVDIVKILDNQGIMGHIEANYAASEMNRVLRAQVDRRRNRMTVNLADSQANGSLFDDGADVNALVRGRRLA